MDKDKTGSVLHFTHQDKLKMDVKKKRTIQVLERNIYKFLYNLGEGNVFLGFKFQKQHTLERFEYNKI